jgi:hypothetical protein
VLNLNTFAVDTYNLEQLFTMDSSIQNRVPQEIRHRMPHDSFPSDTNKYQEIHVLLFSWIDDDLNSSREALRVGRAFQNILKVTSINHAKIPSENSYAHVERTLDNFKRASSHKTSLLIVWYCGHGSLDLKGNLWWVARRCVVRFITTIKSFCLTSSRKGKDPDTPFPALEWYALQPGLEKTDSDVLILLDCCHAGASISTKLDILGSSIPKSGGTTELIAACSSSDVAWAGSTSFSKALVQALSELGSHPLPFSVRDLQQRIFSLMWLKFKTTTKSFAVPQHFKLNGSPNDNISIQALPLMTPTVCGMLFDLIVARWCTTIPWGYVNSPAWRMITHQIGEHKPVHGQSEFIERGKLDDLGLAGEEGTCP